MSFVFMVITAFCPDDTLAWKLWVYKYKQAMYKFVYISNPAKKNLANVKIYTLKVALKCFGTVHKVSVTNKIIIYF